MTPGSGGTGKESSDPMDEDLGTEAPLAEGGDGGTPDLPLPEPRSQPDAADAADAADDADPATAAETASALEDAARKTASAARP